MTVEAYLRARVPGYPFELPVLEDAAISPIFAKPVALKALSLKDTIEDHASDEDWVKALKYATSTLYYSIAGVFSGGSRTEQVGDIRTSQSGFVITKSDRDYYRSQGDELRKQIGADVEESATEQGGMFDATYLTKKTRK